MSGAEGDAAPLDGRRLGQLVASEVAAFAGHAGTRGRLRVVGADRDAQPSEGGTFAYAVADAASDQRVARAFLHPERLRLDVRIGVAAAADAAEAGGLEARRAPGRAVLFVGDGAAVKRVVPVLVAAVEGTTDTAPADGDGNV